MPFIPIPLPEKVIQTSSCTILLYKFVLQTGMGMDINGIIIIIIVIIIIIIIIISSSSSSTIICTHV